MCFATGIEAKATEPLTPTPGRSSWKTGLSITLGLDNSENLGLHVIYVKHGIEDFY